MKYVSFDPAERSIAFKHNILHDISIFSVGKPEGSDAHVISLLIIGGHKPIIVNWHYTPSLSKHT